MGGLVGGFVRSKAGKAVGTGLKEGGEALWVWGEEGMAFCVRMTAGRRKILPAERTC